MADGIAAPTQSAPQVSQTQPTSFAAPVAPVAQSAAQAPVVGTTPQWVASTQQAAAPAPEVQAQMGIAPTQYDPTQSTYQAPQATPQQDNPYKEAWRVLFRSLSSPVQFPFQGQQSTQNQVADQVNYASPQTTPFNNAVAPTSTPGINSNQGYSNDSSLTSQQGLTADQLKASGVSDVSLEVINNFGPDAPAVLNDYACKVEDALIESNVKLTKAVDLLKELNTEHKAYNNILTNPNVLADYTTKFFGPQGPFPVERIQATQNAQAQQAAARAAAPRGAGQVDPRAAAAAGQVDPRAAVAAPQRPQMPVPPSPQSKGTPTDFWNSFGSASDRDPQNAWKYLSAAQQNPEIFRQKLLVME